MPKCFGGYRELMTLRYVNDVNYSSKSVNADVVITLFILYFTVKTNVYQNLIKLVFSLI